MQSSDDTKCKSSIALVGLNRKNERQPDLHVNKLKGCQIEPKA